jgi:hypothetical protein
MFQIWQRVYVTIQAATLESFQRGRHFELLCRVFRKFRSCYVLSVERQGRGSFDGRDFRCNLQCYCEYSEN